MRNYTAICSDGISTDVLSYPSINDFKSKLSQLCGLYKTIIVKQNGNFICKYYKDDDLGIVKATKVNTERWKLWQKEIILSTNLIKRV